MTYGCSCISFCINVSYPPFCASDIPAVLDYTKDICALEDDQMAVLKPGSIELYDFFGDKVSMKWTHISYDACAAQKGGYDTFMQNFLEDIVHISLRHTSYLLDSNNPTYEQ